MEKLTDLTSMKFGKLTVLGPDPNNDIGRKMWYVRCDCNQCGQDLSVREEYLTSGHTKSCGCIKNQDKLIDLTGKKFGRLTVIGRAPNSKNNHTMWFVKCDCSPEQPIRPVGGQELRTGGTQSCGCLKKEKLRANAKENLTGKDVRARAIAARWGDLATKRITAGMGGFRKFVHSISYNAKVRGIEFSLTDDQVMEISKQNCLYCGASPAQVSKRVSKGSRLDYAKHTSFTYNGIDRIDSNRGYAVDNCVPCCFICNNAKSDLTIEAFCDLVCRLHDRLFEIESITRRRVPNQDFF